MTKRKKTKMKKKISLSIFCAVFLFSAVLASPTPAQMQKVDEEELALTHASVTGIVNPEEARSAGTIDKAGSVNFTQTSGSTETVSVGPSMNYQPASVSSMYYHHPWANNGTNQWYWGGGSSSQWKTSSPSR